MKYDKIYKLTTTLILELKKQILSGKEVYVRPVGSKRFVFSNVFKEGYYKLEFPDKDYIKFRLRSLNSMLKKHVS
jgi:hypothetical protein